MIRQDLYLPPKLWPATPSHVPCIDGLRGLSVLIVLVGHILVPKSLVGISAFGLKIFFFISGFLIVRLLFAESRISGRISMPEFYLRRVFRLYPVIIVLVGLSSIFLVANGKPVRAIDVASVFLYFINYLVIYYDHIGSGLSIPVGVLWSLSIEEQFYLFAPLVIILLGYSPKRLAVFACAVCVSCLCFRLYYAHRDPDIVNTLELYWRSETRFDSIAFGMLLACLPEFSAGRSLVERMAKPNVFFAAFVLLGLTFVVRSHYYQNVWRFTFQGLLLIPIFATLIFSGSIIFINKFLTWKAMQIAGMLSYSLYVWHTAIPFFIGSWMQTLDPEFAKWMWFVLCFVVAAVSYWLVERPAIAFRRKLRSQSLKPSAADGARLSS